MPPIDNGRPSRATSIPDDLDLPGYAFEFLRRNPAYAREARVWLAKPSSADAIERARRWGLRFRDRPIWRAEALPFVVLIGPPAHGFGSDTHIHPDALRDVVARFPAGDGLHIVIGSGRTILRLRFEPGWREYGTILTLPEPCERMRGDTARWFLRWLAGRAREPSPEGARMTRFRMKRWRTLLGLIDLRQAGASPRRLAELLIDPDLASLSAAAWTAASERKRIGRWTVEADQLVAGGYRDLLEGR